MTTRNGILFGRLSRLLAAGVGHILVLSMLAPGVTARNTGLSSGASAQPRVAPAPAARPCQLPGGFQFECYGAVITLSSHPVLLGGTVTLTVNPASGYKFDPKTVVVLEPAGGGAPGSGLRTLCGNRGAAVVGNPCPTGWPKSMTLRVPDNGSIAPGAYILNAENWEPSRVVGGVGVCTPACTTATAGGVRFANPPPRPQPGGLKITNVYYPDPKGQIQVQFVDPARNVNRVNIQPWLGYQWGPGSWWNPGVTGLSAGSFYIRVQCHSRERYTAFITLSDAAGRSAQYKLNYTCR